MSGDQVSSRVWTNESVLRFAADKDPLDAAHDAAEGLLAKAVESGADGPPVNVFALAEHLGLELLPKDDLVDAQVRSTESALVIEYNPNRPRGRLRFSIAHELGHICFADVADQPRHRTAAGSVEAPDTGDDWELELICDVIAADLLLPMHAVDGLLTVDPDIDFLMETRRRWDVSTEALLRRIVAATPRPLMLIASSRPSDQLGEAIRVDYAFRSPGSARMLPSLGHGGFLREVEPILACTAVGQTSRGNSKVLGSEYHVQAVGVPPYPGRRWPRVLALIEPPSSRSEVPNLTFVTGDLLDWDDRGPVVLAHVVSDSVRGWSRFGVAGALGRGYPDIAVSYRAWTLASQDNLRLGNVHFVPRSVDGQSLGIASLVAQEGFGPEARVRVQYDALATALEALHEIASSAGASVHIPRLGAGQAGGRWDRIEELLVAKLVTAGVPVVVHTLPGARSGKSNG